LDQIDYWNGGCLNDLRIHILKPADAPDLNHLLTADEPEYRRYFSPFEPSAESIAAILARAQRDRYWGIRSDAVLVGMFMLRGFDDGYRVPAFGVYISQTCSHKGLGNLALQYALAWCRLNSLDEIMLSVHPDNASARRIYEREGFEFNAEYSSKGHWIYRKKLA